MIITVTQIDPEIPLEQLTSSTGLTMTISQAGGSSSTLGGAAVAVVTMALPGSISGPVGPAGPIGPQGVAGQAAQTFVYTQAVAATVWTIAHMLGVMPSIVVVDSAGTLVEGDVHYSDVNNVTLTFGAAFAGTAYLI